MLNDFPNVLPTPYPMQLMGPTWAHVGASMEQLGASGQGIEAEGLARCYARSPMSAEVATNPLLAISHPIRFDSIRAEHVEPAIDRLLADSRERLAVLEQHQGPQTYEATLLAFEESTLALERAMTVVAHLEAVATTPELRAAYNAVQPKVSALMSSIPLSPGLFQMLTGFANTDTARALDATRARFLRKTLDWFKREGAGLAREDKLRLE